MKARVKKAKKAKQNMKALPRPTDDVPVLLNKIERAAIEPLFIQRQQAENNVTAMVSEILMAHGLPAEASKRVQGYNPETGTLLLIPIPS